MRAYCNEKIITKNIQIADNFVRRFVGLLGRTNIEYDEGLLLMNCSSIHCFFMKFTIDAIYLSKNMTVLYIETIRPWKIGKIVKHTCHVLELHEGAAQGISVGEVLDFIE